MNEIVHIFYFFIRLLYRTTNISFVKIRIYSVVMFSNGRQNWMETKLVGAIMHGIIQVE